MLRKPTLHEKISIKGKLEEKGVYGPNIAKMNNFKTILHYWDMCFGTYTLLQFFKGRKYIKEIKI